MVVTSGHPVLAVQKSPKLQRSFPETPAGCLQAFDGHHSSLRPPGALLRSLRLCAIDKVSCGSGAACRKEPSHTHPNGISRRMTDPIGSH